LVLLIVLAVAARRAEAVTIRDVIELSKAGLSDQVLLALIEVDRGVFRIDAPTVKELKEGGVSEAVIVAMIRSGRPLPALEPAPPAEATVPTEPEVIYRDAPAPAPIAVPYPVAVPIYIPVQATRRFPGQDTITTTLETRDGGLVKARVPVPANCVKAEPVYWGFGGKLRPDAWQPPPTVVCR
jgi:hypothetical protein